MTCDDARTLLSAYFDGELTGESELRVRNHLDQCGRCAAELDSFRQLSQLADGLQTPRAPESTWRQLELQLSKDARPRPRTVTWRPSFVTAALLASAATLLMALGIGWLVQGSRSGRAEHEAVVQDFGNYLEAFHDDPQGAQQMLVAWYDGQAVDSNQALQMVGFRPATAQARGDEFRLKSLHVLKMPCCMCVQSVCERPDGSTVVLFEHEEEHTRWFGERTGMLANCGGKRCRLFELQERMAASWTSGSRHITVIGARDADEVGQLVSWLQETPPASSS